MNIKKIVLSWLVTPLICMTSIQADQVEQMPLPSAYDAVNNQQVSQLDIEAMISSDEFNKLAADLGIKDLTNEEREALVQETMEFAQKPYKEQQEELQKMFGDIQDQMPQPQVPAKPEQVPPEQVPPVKKEQAKSEKDKKPVTVSKKAVESLKTLSKKLAQDLENIQISFASLPTVTADILLRQKWENVETDLPFAVSLLRRLSNNAALLEEAASSEFKLLQTQMKEIHQDLKEPRKKLAISDTAQLSKLSAIELSRAISPSNFEKEGSKKAVKKIITLLSSSMQNVTYGLRKLYEKYAPKDLKEIEKNTGTTDKEIDGTLPRTTRSSAYKDYDDSSSYRSSSGRGTPSYSDYDYDDDDDYDDWDTSSGRSSRETGSSFNRPSKTAATGDGKNKTTADKSPTTKTENDLADENKDKKTTSASPEQNEITKSIDALEVKIKDNIEQIASTAKGLANLNLSKIEDREAFDKTRRALQEINPLATELVALTNKWISTTQRDTPEKNTGKENQEKAKKNIFESLDKKESIKKLATVASEVMATETSPDIAEDKVSLISYFKDFLDEYTKTITLLRPSEVLTNKIKEQTNNLNTLIKEKNLLAPLKDAQHKDRDTDEFKKSLTAALGQLDANIKMSLELNKIDPKAKTKSLITSGETEEMIKLLENEKLIPEWAKEEIKKLAKQIQSLI